MSRFPLIALTAIGLWVAAHCWFLTESLSAPSAEAAAIGTVPAIELDDATDDEVTIVERIRIRGEFAAFVDELVLQMAKGNLGLVQARDRLHYYCLVHYPDYLNHVELIEIGGSVNLKLARCLVRFVRDYSAENDGTAESIVADLDVEYASLSAEEECAAVATE
jgi:hypothetical protein